MAKFVRVGSLRALVFSVQTPYKELQQHCNLWRNWVDIQSSWQSLSTIVQFWALASQKSKGFTEVARPGSWNDPDMLIIGNEVRYRVELDMSRKGG